MSQDDNALILSSGEYPGKFPENEFCVYREESDSLSLEVSDSWSENVFGFTLDLNNEDFEYYEGYRLIKFTFLGDDSIPLSDCVSELDEHPAGKEQKLDDENLEIKRQVVRNPFGLNGFFMYETKELTRLQTDTEFEDTEEI